MGLYWSLRRAGRVDPWRHVLSFGKQIMRKRALESVERARVPRALLACLAASVAVHAAVIVGLPEFSFDPPSPPVTVLEVVLVQTELPRPLPVAEARPDPSPKPALPVRREAAKPRATPKSLPKVPPAEAAPPILRLPAPAPVAEVAAPSDHPDAIAPAEIAPPTQLATVAPTPPGFSASYLRNPAPRYPLAARRAGEQGTVTLKVRVTREGLPERVEIEKTSGSPRLDSAALDAVRSWRFVPARRGATPIESWVLVPVVFRLEDPS
jgi:periplasmic protein TonB